MLSNTVKLLRVALKVFKEQVKWVQTHPAFRYLEVRHTIEVVLRIFKQCTRAEQSAIVLCLWFLPAVYLGLAHVPRASLFWLIPGFFGATFLSMLIEEERLRQR